ncbi:hypothetical protein [Caballeronia sp. M1242]|uniref:hypothetical protein n=1 Tax=Caballeronia sp. M1242 TaxID=2814653 RepID=UPI0019D067F2|nr:hypothetical protein [Caballeronia sp. M1242]QSN64968.1 hypothetical protein JYK05_23710 [Caballeronia sp. M1242]
MSTSDQRFTSFSECGTSPSFLMSASSICLTTSASAPSAGTTFTLVCHSIGAASLAAGIAFCTTASASVTSDAITRSVPATPTSTTDPTHTMRRTVAAISFIFNIARILD